jgi:glycosyltransferase involved in cell wall biosynthesis
MKKNFTLLYDQFPLLPFHLVKQITPHINRLDLWNMTIVCFKNKDNKGLPDNIDGMKLIRMKNWMGIFSRVPIIKKLRQLSIFWYLLRNSKKIDILNVYHFQHKTVIDGLFYKFLNKNGFLYIDLDDDLVNIKKSGTFTGRDWSPMEKAFLGKADLFSQQTMEGVVLIKEKIPDLRDKVMYLPGGVDDFFLKNNFKKIKSFKEKENIILTAGRIGSEQKNSDLLLGLIEDIDLKDWKVVFAGPLEGDFSAKAGALIKRRPDLKSKILLTGYLKDRQDFYSWFDRSKVFCLTSKWESFGLVLAEAAYFGEFVITTPVGCAYDLVTGGRYGLVIDRENVSMFKKPSRISSPVKRTFPPITTE